MANQYKNKVALSDGTVLIDLTSDTVTADDLLDGVTAHNSAGEPITGNVSFVNYYTGSGEPPASLGQDGDIYLRTS